MQCKCVKEWYLMGKTNKNKAYNSSWYASMSPHFLAEENSKKSLISVANISRLKLNGAILICNIEYKQNKLQSLENWMYILFVFSSDYLVSMALQLVKNIFFFWRTKVKDLW